MTITDSIAALVASNSLLTQATERQANQANTIRLLRDAVAKTMASNAWLTAECHRAREYGGDIEREALRNTLIEMDPRLRAAEARVKELEAHLKGESSRADVCSKLADMRLKQVQSMDSGVHVYEYFATTGEMLLGTGKDLVGHVQRAWKRIAEREQELEDARGLLSVIDAQADHGEDPKQRRDYGAGNPRPAISFAEAVEGFEHIVKHRDRLESALAQSQENLAAAEMETKEWYRWAQGMMGLIFWSGDFPSHAELREKFEHGYRSDIDVLKGHMKNYATEAEAATSRLAEATAENERVKLQFGGYAEELVNEGWPGIAAGIRERLFGHPFKFAPSAEPAIDVIDLDELVERREMVEALLPGLGEPAQPVSKADELPDATGLLHDRIHPTSGKLLNASPAVELAMDKESSWNPRFVTKESK